MGQKPISLIQAVSLMLLFEFGSSVILGVNTQTGQDSWITLIVGALIACPFMLIYARILKLYPGKSVFEIMDLVLGKVAGKILCALMTWYAIHLCALVIRNFSEFTEISTLQETPQLPIMILLMLVVVYLAKSGNRTLGKWSIPIICVVLFVAISTAVLSIPEANFENLLPIFEHNASEILQGSVGVASFPYLETVLFLCVGNYFCKQDTYKIFMYSLAIVAVIFLVVVIRNLVLLGEGLLKLEYFPSFAAARLINLGSIFPKIEGTISMNFVLAGIVKITICLIAAVKGVCHLFGIEDTRRMIVPVGLIALALAAIIYKSAMEMFKFVDYYWIYAFPFQVIIPLVVWFAAELERRRRLRGTSGRSRGRLANADRAGPVSD